MLAGGDAVHGDYHPGNVRAIGQTVTGVVDWAIRHLSSPEVDAYVQAGGDAGEISSRWR